MKNNKKAYLVSFQEAHCSSMSILCKVSLMLICLFIFSLVFITSAMAIDVTSKYYTTDNPFYKSGYGLPNCTCFAWGRAYEATGTKPTTSTANARNWYNYNIQRGYYPYGTEPMPGAIACWDDGPDGVGGHVAYVESVSGTEVTLSQSGWGWVGKIWEYKTVNKNNMDSVLSGFQGYIYVGGIGEPPFAYHPRGDGGNYAVGEKVELSLKNSPSSSAILYVYRTPLEGGEAQIYWEGEVNPSLYEMTFPYTGHYSCYYKIGSISSEWVGWYVYPLNASADKGQDGLYAPRENVTLSVNATSYDQCRLHIIRTPSGGETYTYYDDVVNVNSVTRPFYEEGYYACCFTLTSCGNVVESAWVGWSVTDYAFKAVNPKGEGGIFVVGEKVKLSLNTTEFTSADLLIYRTPTGGDPYEFWRGNVNPNTYEVAFTQEGFYSCCYAVSIGDQYVGSKWIGWNVIPLQAQHPKGSGGYYELNEPVRLSLNTDAFTQANLSIIRTPQGGTIGLDADSYLYWQGEVNPNTYETSFSAGGYYSCGFTVYDENSKTYESSWIDWNVYTRIHVHYDPNGGTGGQSDNSKFYNVPLKLSTNTPTREGYEFLGWAMNPDATTAQYHPGDVFDVPDGDYTIYAVWQSPTPDFILPAGTTTVEEYAFQGCAFTYVRLSDETTTLGNGAFADCPNLKHVYLPMKTVIIGSNVFPAGVTIHGKDGSYAEFYANKFGYDFIAE